MAKLETDIETLRRVPFFASFGVDELRLLAFSAEERALAAGERLFAAGDRADGGYVVSAGRLDMIQGADQAGPVVVASLGPGSLVGELSLVIDNQFAADGVATAGTRVLHIRRAAFKRVLAEYPDIARRLHHLIAGRLAGAAGELDRVRVALERIAL